MAEVLAQSESEPSWIRGLLDDGYDVSCLSDETKILDSPPDRSEIGCLGDEALNSLNNLNATTQETLIVVLVAIFLTVLVFGAFHKRVILVIYLSFAILSIAALIIVSLKHGHLAQIF